MIMWGRQRHSQACQYRQRSLCVERLEAREMLAADVIISEFLASNSGGLRDGDGDSSDWIELYNTTSAAVDLSGYYLTDDAGELDQWQFPTGTVINANSTLLVFASGKADSPPPGEVHTSFKVSAGGEFLALVAPDGSTIVDGFVPEFPPQITDVSYGVSMTGTSTTLVDDTTEMRYTVPTNGADDLTWKDLSFADSSWSVGTAGLGYESSPGGSPNYAALLDTEVPAGTTSAYARFEFDVVDASALSSLTLDMLYDDGFVAYLNGQLIASASAPANPVWNSIATGQRSDNDVLDDYVSFDVSSALGALVDGDNVLAIHALNVSSSSDMLMIPQLVGAESALIEPLQYGSFQTPTPNASNGEVFVGIVADTKFSVDRGFYDAPFDVEITTDTEGALIVYSTDGSEPSVDENLNVTNGMAYSAPLTVSHTTTLRAAAFKQGFIPTNVDTQTYLFIDDVIEQTYSSTLAAGFPSTWGSRAADYGLDPDVIGPNDLFGGFYAAQIEGSLLSIPTISIAVDNDDFFGPSGIYANPTGEGVVWERPASAELIYPDGGEGFQVYAGLRIAGAASRTLSLKNGLRLLFKGEYGASKLEFPLFGDGVDEFDTVVLRPHFNDGWGWDGAQGDPLYARDQWFRNTQIAMGHDSPRGNLAHLYINGLYWGLYNPSERPDDSYNAELLGGDKTEYDVMVATGVHDGTADAYNSMISLAGAVNSAADVAAKNAAYQQLQGHLPDGTDDPAAKAYLDVENYIDYMLLNHYGGNDDWPNRNWYAARRRGDESLGFRFYTWDSEIALDLSDRTSLGEDYTGQSSGAAQAYSILRNYEEFRLQFADRIHHHLFNGGALYVNPDNPTYAPAHPEDNVPAARFAEIANQVGQAIVAESARWGDQHVSFPRTKNIDWQNSLDYILGPYFAQRHGIVLAQWKAAGLYPDADAPELIINGNRQHGGTMNAGDMLTFENSNTGPTGTIYFTTDGSDPRLVGGAVNTVSAQTYSSPLSLDASTHVKARILHNGEWSALTEATFIVPSADFDNNSVVDGLDFLAWQRGFGRSNPTAADGDAELDGDVDGDDLAVWQTQYGTALTTTVTAAALVSSAGNAEPNVSSDQSDLWGLTDGSLPPAWLSMTSGPDDSLDQATALEPFPFEQTAATDPEDLSLTNAPGAHDAESLTTSLSKSKQSLVTASTSDQVFEEWDDPLFSRLDFD